MKIKILSSRCVVLIRSIDFSNYYKFSLVLLSFFVSNSFEATASVGKFGLRMGVGAVQLVKQGLTSKPPLSKGSFFVKANLSERGKSKTFINASGNRSCTGSSKNSGIGGSSAEGTLAEVSQAEIKAAAAEVRAVLRDTQFTPLSNSALENANAILAKGRKAREAEEAGANIEAAEAGANIEAAEAVANIEEAGSAAKEEAGAVANIEEAGAAAQAAAEVGVLEEELERAYLNLALVRVTLKAIGKSSTGLVVSQDSMQWILDLLRAPNFKIAVEDVAEALDKKNSSVEDLKRMIEQIESLVSGIPRNRVFTQSSSSAGGNEGIHEILAAAHARGRVKAKEEAAAAAKAAANANEAVKAEAEAKAAEAAEAVANIEAAEAAEAAAEAGVLERENLNREIVQVILKAIDESSTGLVVSKGVMQRILDLLRASNFQTAVEDVATALADKNSSVEALQEMSKQTEILVSKKQLAVKAAKMKLKELRAKNGEDAGSDQDEYATRAASVRAASVIAAVLVIADAWNEESVLSYVEKHISRL